MSSELFKKREENFAGEGELTAFNLACVAEALDTIAELNEQNVGGETVEERLGEYKSWDPEIFKVDKDTEDGFRNRLEERGKPIILLSEEAGRVEINAGAAGEKVYCVADPFDGSYLFKRGIPDFWYSSLSFFDENVSDTQKDSKLNDKNEAKQRVFNMFSEVLEHTFSNVSKWWRKMKNPKKPLKTLEVKK